MNIYLLSGPIASGKGTLAEYISESEGEENIEIFVLSDILRKEAHNRGLPINRDTLEFLGLEFRTKDGPGALGKIIIKNVREALENGKHVVVDSLRNPAEVSEIKKHFPQAVLTFVYAPMSMRLKRAGKRNRDDDSLMKDLENILKRELEISENGFNLEAIRLQADIELDGGLEKEDMCKAFECELEVLKQKKKIDKGPLFNLR